MPRTLGLDCCARRDGPIRTGPEALFQAQEAAFKEVVAQFCNEEHSARRQYDDQQSRRKSYLCEEREMLMDELVQWNKKE